MALPETNVPETKISSKMFPGTYRAMVLTSYVTPDGWSELPKGLQYFCYGDEICPTTQRPHKQGFAYSTNAMRFPAWQKIFPRIRLAPMLGSFAQNEVYCSKKGSYHVFGVEPMLPSHKRSLEELVGDVSDAADLQVPLDEVVTIPENRSTFVQYNGGIQRLYNMQVTKRLRATDVNLAPEVLWFHGPPGSGKTRTTLELHPQLYRVPTSNQYKWKDGYCGQDAVLYDNVSPKNIDPDTFLQEIDRYYMQVPVKGGFIGWRPKIIYITSVMSPDDMVLAHVFSNGDELLRRITCIREFTI